MGTRARCPRVMIAVWLAVLTVLVTVPRGAQAQAPSALPRLVLLTNQPAFGPGAGLSVTLGLQHAGAPLVADLYFGVILPDGVSVVYFEGLGLATRQGRLNDLASIRPMLAGLGIATGTNIVVPDFFRYTWQGHEPHGTYQFFFAATTPGALRDGRVDSGELLVMETQSVLNLPPATITTDVGHGSSAQVGPAGGTVVATAANGTVYTLTVPRGALDRPTTISLTPVTGLTGWPVPVTLAAGIRGTPDGLRFAIPATLRVELAQDVSGLAFGMPMPDSGAGFDVVPVARDGRFLTLQVGHFSTVAIPESTDALIGLMTSTSNFMMAWQLMLAAGPDFGNPPPAAVQAVLDFLVSWYDTEITAQAQALATLGAADEQRLDWLTQFVAWDNSRATFEEVLGSVSLGGQSVRGRLTPRASAGRQTAAIVLGDGYAAWNTDCRAFSGPVRDRLRLAVRAARFAVLTEVYLQLLASNQASALVGQAADPDRELAGISPQQIATGYCLGEVIQVTEPNLAPGQSGQLRVRAGTTFQGQATTFGDFMEVSFQPDPNSTAGLEVRQTDPQGEARFTVTADASGTVKYFVCASYPGEFEPAGWVTLVYRPDQIPCDSAVTGVVVSPPQTTIMPGQSRQFTAVVEGTSNQAVTWSMSGGGGITQNGLFTSNGTTGTFFVTATSVEDPSAVGIAQVTVTLPCVDSACTFSGTWTRCEILANGTRRCEDFTAILSSPRVEVFPVPGDTSRIAVSFTCTRTLGVSVMGGPIQPSGTFSAAQLTGSNVCILGTMTGTLTPNTLNLTIVDGFNARNTFTFSTSSNSAGILHGAGGRGRQ